MQGSWCGTNYDPAARQLIFVTHFTANETPANELTVSQQKKYFSDKNVFSHLLLLTNIARCSFSSHIFFLARY